MKIEAIHGSDMTFDEWISSHGLELIAVERPNWCHVRSTPEQTAASRWYVHAKGVEVMDRSMLVGEHGNGPTPEAAKADYERVLRGKRVCVNAMRPERREIQCPNEWKAAQP